MKPAPDVEITGTVCRCNVERDDQGAVLVAYVDTTDGKAGRLWVRFPPEAIAWILARLTPATTPTTPTTPTPEAPMPDPDPDCDQPIRVTPENRAALRGALEAFSQTTDEQLARGESGWRPDGEPLI